MEPSEVRTRVLADHERLRLDLERLADRATEIQRGACAAVDSFRAEAEAFVASLREHMEWEESWLAPLLRQADAWGAERAARLEDDHCEQREVLDLIVARLREPGRPAALVARDVAGLVELLCSDIRHEESTFLDERVLRDDAVGVDVETG